MKTVMTEASWQSVWAYNECNFQCDLAKMSIKTIKYAQNGKKQKSNLHRCILNAVFAMTLQICAIVDIYYLLRDESAS